MEEGIPLCGILLFGAIMIVDCILYGFGAAAQSLNENLIEKQAEEGNKKAKKLMKILDYPVIYVNTLQLLTVLANMIVGAYEFQLLKNYIYRALMNYQLMEHQQMIGVILSSVLSGIVFLYILLTFGILVPKKIAKQHGEAWAFALVNVVSFFVILLKPITYVINITANLCIQLLHMDPDKKDDVTEEEIISMVNEGMEQGVIEDSEAEMITNIFEFGDKAAKDVMNHRSSMIAVDGEMSLQDAICFMLDENKSRYPVYENDIDNVIGILHLRDAIRMSADGSLAAVPVRAIEGLVRKAVFIPETRGVRELFTRMKQQKIQMVIVVDEYGQTAGFITLEDILEEIVGNLLDEYEEEENLIEQKAEDTYLMSGLTPLEEVGDVLNLDFDDVEIETLNGLLISTLNRIPSEDEKPEVEYEGYRFHILQIENKIIQKVMVEKLYYNNTENNTETNTSETK